MPRTWFFAFALLGGALAGLAITLVPVHAAVYDGGGVSEGIGIAESVNLPLRGDAANVVRETLGRVRNYLALIAVIVIVLAGFYLILGFGDDNSRTKAKNVILYTAIGMAIVLLAEMIVDLIYFLLGSGGNEALRGRTVDILTRIVQFVALLATIVIITGGLFLIGGFGSDSSKEKAKKMIFYTLIGILVIGFGSMIVRFFAYLVTG